MRFVLAVILLAMAGCGGGAPGSVGGLCVQSSDCHKGNPDECNICKAGQTDLVCFGGRCECACNAN